VITTGVLRGVLAFTELQFSNAMIEAWWRSQIRCGCRDCHAASSHIA
jgi:hypothetical protein